MTSSGRLDHDALYHRLFSHPGVVAELVREFVAGPWLAGLDLDGMERLNTKFHAETGERREGDVIWRIPRLDGEDSYLLLLLEFQSKSDPYMAVRVQAYTALLWQHLIREQRLTAGDRLPPLLPVVLHNGDSDWRAPVALRHLIDLPEASALWQWQPELRYHLIDVNAFTESELQARNGLPALWFRLEAAPNPERVAEVAQAVLSWLARHPDFSAVRAAFIDLMGALMSSPGSGIRLPEDVGEGQDMLLTRVEQWKQDWLLEGRQEGRQAGEAAMLLRLLERRFGALPAWATDRVTSADTRLLEDWGVRVLDGGSLEDVLGAGPA